jgi:endonuclease YncB( thermonuclease family)
MEKIMAEFKVINVVDGDTFDVSPNWVWNGQEGTRIRIANFDAPELGQPGGKEAKEKLENLILHKIVDLRKCVAIDRGRLICDVYLNGVNIVTLLQ